MQGCRLAAPTEDWDEKGKVSSRCFWNACKALSFGLLLMFIGTAMATLGYYADQLSVEQEMRGNTTVRIKHEARGFHLNNLSYAGPIVMGVGGFIVVAACVMTFEARDSAAKVVPTPRTRAPSQRKPAAGTCRGSRRSTSSQTKWPESASPDLLARRAITASFVQFSRELGARPLGKSPSAPDLAAEPPRFSPRQQPSAAHAGLLSPHVLLQRQALSVDNPEYGCFSPPIRPGSQASMALDLHLENPVTLRVRDRTRRSDTARRHVFVRQRPVEEDERSHSWSPRYYRGEEYKSLSTPHSRRESMARTPRGSTEERPVRSSSHESRLRKKSTSSRSASERSQLTPEDPPYPAPARKESEIIVIEPKEESDKEEGL